MALWETEFTPLIGPVWSKQQFQHLLMEMTKNCNMNEREHLR